MHVSKFPNKSSELAPNTHIYKLKLATKNSTEYKELKEMFPIFPAHIASYASGQLENRKGNS